VSGSTLHDDLTLARHAADVADAVTLPAFDARTFRVDRKPDATEVTEIDRAAESAISSMLQSERPEYSLYGEEHGTVGPSGAARQWVIDPIDGTSNFVRGVPIWATLIALVENGVPIIGVVSAPALGRRWWAAQGSGAYRSSVQSARNGSAHSGTQMHVSAVEHLGESSASITVTESWHRAGKTARLDALQRDVKRLRNYGDFWQHMLVAEGTVDFAVDAIGLGAYDNAAIYPIVTEAGGRASDRLGASDYRSNSLITSNGRLHDAVLGALGGDR
jgi:histidinol-phosphatase